LRGVVVGVFNYRKAFEPDPNIAKGLTADAYVAGKISPAPVKIN
jgi:hypothetical protein